MKLYTGAVVVRQGISDVREAAYVLSMITPQVVVIARRVGDAAAVDVSQLQGVTLSNTDRHVGEHSRGRAAHELGSELCYPCLVQLLDSARSCVGCTADVACLIDPALLEQHDVAHPAACAFR